MKIYILEAIRNGIREEHSYVQGAYLHPEEAIAAADAHCLYRAMKYSVLVHEIEVGKNYDDDTVPTDFDSEIYRAKAYFDTKEYHDAWLRRKLKDVS
jgi:hypothetical protein